MMLWGFAFFLILDSDVVHVLGSRDQRLIV